MKRYVWLVLLFGLAAPGCVTTAIQGGDAAVIRAKDRVAPAVVHIRPVKEVYAQGRREEVLVVGSGFIITPDGYVVTNEHVAGESRIVRCVLYDRSEVDATVVGTDRYTDIALLKLETDRTDLPTVRLGASDTLTSGQTVLALGSPHGLARTVSMGIISETRRFLGEGGGMMSPYNTWIQTDAAINPGNSGGPLVNLAGEVVGVNTRRMSGADNVGFAIPIDIAKEVVDALREDGRVTRSWFGVTLQEMMSKTDDLSQRGVVIADVEGASTAAQAGIRPGDTLLAVDGVEVDARYAEDLPRVHKLIADLEIGRTYPLRIGRGDEVREIPVETEERSELEGKEVEFAEWGFTASEITPAFARRMQLPSTQGVLVSGVQVGGYAANAGLVEGDILLTMDGHDLTDFQTFQELYEERATSGQRLVLLDVRRGALMRFVLIKQVGEDVAETEMGSEPNEQD